MEGISATECTKESELDNKDVRLVPDTEFVMGKINTQQ